MSTNYYPWRDYIPKAAWLVGQYNAHKLSHDEFIDLSAKFRTGHERRKRDAEAALADERKWRRIDESAQQGADLGPLPGRQSELEAPSH